jgi:hypothetical protein
MGLIRKERKITMHTKLLRTAELLRFKLNVFPRTMPDNCSYGTTLNELASHATKGVGTKSLEGMSKHFPK